MLKNVRVEMCGKGRAPVRVLVADGHRMVREGVRVMLEEVGGGWDRFLVDMAGTSEEAMAKVMGGDFGVVLMDYWLPGRGGVKATELLLAKRPGSCILGLAYTDERGWAERMMAAGARGVVLKNIGAETLVTAIRTVMDGRRFYSNEVALRLLEPVKCQVLSDSRAGLSSREKEVLRLILEGLRDREVAERLGIGKRTVDKHRQHLMAKLGVRSAVGLVRAAMEMGMMG
jgi:DNA-binding NarL/FixJ family response regulator